MSEGAAMTLILILFAVGLVVLLASRSRGRVTSPLTSRVPRRNSVHEAIEETKDWQDLGALPDAPMQAALAKLEQALPSGYVDQIRQRYLSQHPQCSPERFELLLLELKRYFILCSLLRSVPMFSEEVDGLWHEMLMYTREYDRFGRELIGGPLHHAPAAEIKPDPGSRAWFDLAYSALFRFHAFAPAAWGGFFRHPLDAERLEQIQSSSKEQLHTAFFRPEADEQLASYVLDKLILKMKEAGEARSSSSSSVSSELQASRYNDPGYGGMLTGMLLMSSMGGSFQEDMDKHLPADDHNRSGSGCSAMGCAGGDSEHEDGSGSGTDGSDSSGDSGGDSGSGSDGSSSSCSSSSCSSCGGGD